MSSPVSPRQRDIGEVARLRAEGVDRQPRSGFPASRETEKLRSCNVDPIRTPPPAAPPLSALSRGRGGHCYVSQSCNSTSIFARIRRTFIKIRLIYTEEDIATSRQPQQ